jgi:serine/threonine-protein kinase
MTLGEYTVEGKIGEGGMGSVFAAVHPLIGKRAAVKVLKKELCEDPITLERFVDEARVVNQIGHPNIVDVFAFGTLPDGRSYFVMEWLKGQSLRDRLTNGPIHYLEACGILKSLSRALEAAHEKGIIHRDLKPDNVFLVEERGDVPRVKLLDFGIAKLVRQDQSVSRTATGAMIGTPQYVAPEQAKGHAIDARVDIYSLGCVAFELLTGRPPFVADNAMEMVAKHLMEAPPRPSSLEPGIPKDLDDIVLECLSKDREQRPTLTEISATLDTTQRTPAPRASDQPRDSKVSVNDGISLSVTRPVDIGELVAAEHRRRRRRNILAGIALVLGGVATGAVAFMVVSSLKESSEHAAPAAEPAPAPAPTPVAPTPDLGSATLAPTPPPAPPPPAPAIEQPKPPPPVHAPKSKPTPAPTPPPHVVHEKHPTPPPAPPKDKPAVSSPQTIKVPEKDGLMKMKVPESGGLMRPDSP